MGKMYTRF